MRLTDGSMLTNIRFNQNFQHISRNDSLEDKILPVYI